MRARQRALRRRAPTGAFAVLTLATGAAVALAALPGADRDSLRSPDQVAGAPSGGPLVSGTTPHLEFPLSVGWLPDGVRRTPRVTSGGSGLAASYDDAARPQLIGIEVWSSDRDVTFTGDGVARRATTVDGHPGILATLADSVALGWQPSPGRWLAVIGGNQWGEELIVRKVAGALVDRPMSVASAFTLELVPRDSELADWDADGMLVFVPRGQTAQWRSRKGADTAVEIAVRRTTSELTGHGESVTVQDRHGWLATGNEGQHTLVVQLSAQTCLVLDTPAWSREDVLRLAEATRYTGGTPPPEG